MQQTVDRNGKQLRNLKIGFDKKFFAVKMCLNSDSSVVQSVERRTVNPYVAGSSPAGGAKNNKGNQMVAFFIPSISHFLNLLIEFSNEIYMILNKLDKEITMSKALIVYTQGTEDIESTAVLDILKRGGVNVVTASVSADGSRLVNLAHGSTLLCQQNIEDVNEDFDLIVVPGGPGTKSYSGCQKLIDMLKSQKEKKGLIGAICAAPGFILYSCGILKNTEKASTYPGCECGAKFSEKPVSVNPEENIITGRGPNYAIPFALELLKALEGEAKAKEVADGILFNE